MKRAIITALLFAATTAATASIARAQVPVPDPLHLPPPLDARFNAIGGAAVLGAPLWAAGGGCALVVYEHGALASGAGSFTYAVLPPIFEKWSAWADTFAHPKTVNGLCPVSELERGHQDFFGGRIYALKDGSLRFMPQAFVRAARILLYDLPRFEDYLLGLPMADPQRATGTHTWLFQRFQSITGVITTMEIKGEPPTLWIERQTEPGPYLQVPRFGAGTAALKYACKGPEGPCTVRPPPEGFIDAGAVCSNAGVPGGGLTPEWVSLIRDYATSPFYGIVVLGGPAGWDAPSTHDCMRGIWSDYHAYVQPLPSSRTMLNTGARTMEIEIEMCRIEGLFGMNPGLGQPQRGDLIFAGGRHIVDCGHSDDFHTEMHPPSVLAYSRTEGQEPSLHTITNVWVNGYYPGDDVDLDLFPPPRPSPTAFLSVRKPTDLSAALDVDISFETDKDAHSFVRIHFSADPRYVDVDRGVGGSGEMHYREGRGYQGQWTIGWRRWRFTQSESLSSSWWPSGSKRCELRTCEEADAQCGLIDDACGGKTWCGRCGGGGHCASGGCVVSSCEAPATCESVEAVCGAIDDGCRRSIDCGTCAERETCNNHQCNAPVCVPAWESCDDLGWSCGRFNDGCGNDTDCGTCPKDQACFSGQCSKNPPAPKCPCGTVRAGVCRVCPLERN